MAGKKLSNGPKVGTSTPAGLTRVVLTTKTGVKVNTFHSERTAAGVTAWMKAYGDDGAQVVADILNARCDSKAGSFISSAENKPEADRAEAVKAGQARAKQFLPSAPKVKTPEEILLDAIAAKVAARTKDTAGGTKSEAELQKILDSM